MLSRRPATTLRILPLALPADGGEVTTHAAVIVSRENEG